MSTPDTSAPLQRTALYDCHVELGAKIVPFAGWEMPVLYTGIREEVKAVRETCGIFDVSHMGQLWISGAGATEKLNRAISNDWINLPIGRAGYALLLDEQGGVLDDVMGYHLDEDEWLVVVNASRTTIDEMILNERLSGLHRKNRCFDQVMIAVQGPQAVDILNTIDSVFDASNMKWRDCSVLNDYQTLYMIARGGYTGADGFEIMCDAATGVLLWRELIKKGAIPCGLGARDVLRLEAGLPLYGHELREALTPFESASGFAVKMDKEFFVGQDALRGKENSLKTIKALKMEGKAIPREGYKVLRDGMEIGEVTSGTLSPTLESGIALAMLPREVQIGDAVEILIRDKTHAAQIVKKPFVVFGKK